MNAFLLLLAIAGGLFFIGQISKTTTADNNQAKQNRPVVNMVLSASAAKGQSLFMSKCASCHALFKHMVGPGLKGFEERGPWSERKNVYDWIHNPAAFMEKNQYARELKSMYDSMMTAFPDLSNVEIDAICDFIKESENSQIPIPVAKR